MVDDHSTDNSPSIAIAKTKNEQRFQILQLPDNLVGKKDALKYGIKQCKGEFILFTDADCEISPNWVETITKEMTHNNLEFCSGALLIHDCKNILQKLQAVETLFLTAVGHSLISCKKPVLCNGANIAIKRETNDTTLLNHVSSGDDIFRLQQAVKAKRRIDTQLQKRHNILKSRTYFIENDTAKGALDRKIKTLHRDIFINIHGFYWSFPSCCSCFDIYLACKNMDNAFGYKILSETILTVKAMSVYDHKVSPFNIFAVGILYPFYSVAIAIISLFIKTTMERAKGKGLIILVVI